MIQDIYPHKLNNQYHPDQKPDADSIILYFTQDGLRRNGAGRSIFSG